MIQLPSAIGLILCEKALVEVGTKNITLVNVCDRIHVESITSPAQPFTVYAILTDGLGKVRVSFAINRVSDLEHVYGRSWSVTWTWPRQRATFLFAVRDCIFPTAGEYEVSFLANNETVSQHRVAVTGPDINEDPQE